MAGKGDSNLPTLRFTPYAWRKLVFFRDIQELEVGGFGVCTSDDPLFVEDFALVKQECGTVSIEFDDNGLADYYDDMTDEGLHPNQYSRIWIHTHPDIGASPSKTDEDTFKEKFSSPDWAVMFILAKGGQTTCELRFNRGPGMSVEIPIGIDYTTPFPAADEEAEEEWKESYDQLVTEVVYSYTRIGFHHQPYTNYSHKKSDRQLGQTKVVKGDGYGNNQPLLAVESGVEWQDDFACLEEYDIGELEKKYFADMTEGEWEFYSKKSSKKRINRKLRHSKGK